MVESPRVITTCLGEKLTDAVSIGRRAGCGVLNLVEFLREAAEIVDRAGAVAFST